MNGLPLHPAIVHLPLALAMLMPFVAGAFAWAWFTSRVGPRAWVFVVALQALLLGSSLLAINTGGQEEERVENVVSERALEAHEEAAEQFAWAVGGTLALSALVLLFRKPGAASTLAAASMVATVIVAGLALRVGHAGGQLVYVQGAASAYASAGAAGRRGPALIDSARDTGDADDNDDDKGTERR